METTSTKTEAEGGCNICRLIDRWVENERTQLTFFCLRCRQDRKGFSDGNTGVMLHEPRRYYEDDVFMSLT